MATRAKVASSWSETDDFTAVPLSLFKNARLDDGLLDVLVFQNQSHWDFSAIFKRLLLAIILRCRMWSIFRVAASG